MMLPDITPLSTTFDSLIKLNFKSTELKENTFADVRIAKIDGSDGLENVLAWCENNHCEWLSLPEYVRLKGLHTLPDVATLCPHREWWTPNISKGPDVIDYNFIFNSYLFPWGEAGRTSADDTFQLIAGHKLCTNIDHLRILTSLKAPYDLDVLRRYFDVSAIAEKGTLVGMDNIAWLQLALLGRGYTTDAGKFLLGEDPSIEQSIESVFSLQRDFLLRKVGALNYNGMLQNVPQNVGISLNGALPILNASNCKPEENVKSRNYIPVMRKEEYADYMR